MEWSEGKQTHLGSWKHREGIPISPTLERQKGRTGEVSVLKIFTKECPTLSQRRAAHYAKTFMALNEPIRDLCQFHKARASLVLIIQIRHILGAPNHFS